MKKSSSIWMVLLLAITMISCNDNSNPTNPGNEVEEASAQKQFVWNAMNYWYYWQSDVPELGDDYFADNEEFQNYLKDFSDPETLFNELLYTQEDDFSFFIDDYETYGQARQGTSLSFGYEFGLIRFSEDSDNIFGYVQYIVPDSPAEDAGMARGNIFTKIDGTQLTVNNYLDLLIGAESYELTLADIEDNTIADTGSVDLDAVTLTEDPIFISKVIDTSATKVGYLMYNAFQTNSHENLNDVFNTFKSENIDELVIDLRYNGGGAGITGQTLGGMISGLDSSNVFSRYAYNEKRSGQLNRSVSILEEVPVYNDEGNQESTAPMNTVGLTRFYVLTDRGTASASEVLINGLDPYIEVILIGRQTIGKDEGSYTLYDAPGGQFPYLSESRANPDHKIAIQPIALKVVNTNGREYPDGFAPDYEINELDYLEEGLPPLGTADDPLLAKALELITGQPMAKKVGFDARDFSAGKMLIDSRDMRPHGKGLYIDPSQAKQLNLPGTN